MMLDNKAALYRGDKTITVEQLARPCAAENEALINVAWCGICGTDLHIYQGHMDKRVKIPQVMGHELSGTIVTAPPGGDLKPGDRVVVEPTVSCGNCPACVRGFSHICHNLKFLGIDAPGAFQQFWNVPVDRVHKIPADLPFDLAALVEPLAVAVHDVRRAGVNDGDRVAVIGGGPIGLLIAMVARQRGAKVTILEIDEFRLRLAAELGFDIVNSRQEDPVAAIMGRTENIGADVVFEVTSSTAGAAMMTELVRVRGTISIVGIFSQPVPVNLFRFFWREITAHGSRVYERCDFIAAIDLIASGVLPLERVISERITLDGLAQTLSQLTTKPGTMKVLVECV